MGRWSPSLRKVHQESGTPKLICMANGHSKARLLPRGRAILKPAGFKPFPNPRAVEFREVQQEVTGVIQKPANATST